MTTIAHLVGTGGHVIMINDVYGGTNRFFSKVAPNYGITLTILSMEDPQMVVGAMHANTKLVWIETPTNPTLAITDIKAITDAVHAASKEALVVVDNTFLSPIFQTPLDLGADIVLHSATKYLNGHCDVVMGVVVVRDSGLRDRIAFYQNALGGIPSPFDCYMVFRGIKTLHLRMERHAQNAQTIAEFLEKSPHVEKVIYPGLPSHPQHELAKRQQRGFGGMISMVLKGKLEQASKFTQATKLFTLAESLGGVESLIEIPAIMTHGSVSPAEREALGIHDTFIRLSIGIESVKDLIEDLQQAFRAVYE